MFNPHARPEPHPLMPGHTAWVVDDLLAEPERWVALAAEHREAFETTTHNAYPGPELRMPDALSARLDAWFGEHIRARLGARRTLRMYSRLAIVTRAPGELDPRQWLPHRDRMGMAPDECAAAAVTYLFHDTALGGTSFWRPRRPLDEVETLIADSARLDARAFSQHYGLAQGYIGTDTAWFERVATIPPRYNRAIFYDGGLFHCSDIPHPERLDPDPRRGRLTWNGFWLCRRQAD